jgi:hypothetical protein
MGILNRKPKEQKPCTSCGQQPSDKRDGLCPSCRDAQKKDGAPKVPRAEKCVSCGAAGARPVAMCTACSKHTGCKCLHDLIEG